MNLQEVNRLRENEARLNDVERAVKILIAELKELTALVQKVAKPK